MICKIHLNKAVKKYEEFHLGLCELALWLVARIIKLWGLALRDAPQR